MRIGLYCLIIILLSLALDAAFGYRPQEKGYTAQERSQMDNLVRTYSRHHWTKVEQDKAINYLFARQ